MTKQQRTVDRELYNYESNMKKAANYAASHAFDNFGMDYSSPRVKTSPRNSSESKVIEWADEERRAWLWCVVFQRTFTKFRWEKKDELMRKKYIEKKSPVCICRELHIDRATYFRWLCEVRITGEQWAHDLKII